MGTMDLFSGSLTYITQQLGRLSLPVLLLLAALLVNAAFAATMLLAGAWAPTPELIQAAPLRW